jgi:hypothetical protein
MRRGGRSSPSHFVYAPIIKSNGMTKKDRRGWNLTPCGFFIVLHHCWLFNNDSQVHSRVNCAVEFKGSSCCEWPNRLFLIDCRELERVDDWSAAFGLRFCRPIIPCAVLDDVDHCRAVNQIDAAAFCNGNGVWRKCGALQRDIGAIATRAGGAARRVAAGCIVRRRGRSSWAATGGYQDK